MRKLIVATMALLLVARRLLHRLAEPRQRLDPERVRVADDLRAQALPSREDLLSGRDYRRRASCGRRPREVRRLLVDALLLEARRGIFWRDLSGPARSLYRVRDGIVQR